MPILSVPLSLGEPWGSSFQTLFGVTRQIREVICNAIVHKIEEDDSGDVDDYRDITHLEGGRLDLTRLKETIVLLEPLRSGAPLAPRETYLHSLADRLSLLSRQLLDLGSKSFHLAETQRSYGSYRLTHLRQWEEPGPASAGVRCFFGIDVAPMTTDWFLKEYEDSVLLKELRVYDRKRPDVTIQNHNQDQLGLGMMASLILLMDPVFHSALNPRGGFLWPRLETDDQEFKFLGWKKAGK
jgi:hypothetical protein